MLALGLSMGTPAEAARGKGKAAGKGEPERFTVPESRHVQIGVDLEGGPSFQVFGEGRRVVFALSRRQPLRFAVSSYRSAGSVTQERIAASFGELGGIALEFRPGRVQRKPAGRNCEGGPTVITHGVYVGRLRFLSEDGSVDIDVRRVKGTQTVTSRLRCTIAGLLFSRKKGAQGKGGKPGAGLPGLGEFDDVAFTVGNCDSMSLSVSQPRRRFKPGTRVETSISAIKSERLGKVRVVRLLVGAYDETAFGYAPDLSSATVEPTWLFTGSGAYARDPTTGAGTWTGDLAVQFPGKEVPLVVPGLQAELTKIQSFKQAIEALFGPRCPRLQAP